MSVCVSVCRTCVRLRLIGFIKLLQIGEKLLALIRGLRLNAVHHEDKSMSHYSLKFSPRPSCVRAEKPSDS